MTNNNLVSLEAVRKLVSEKFNVEMQIVRTAETNKTDLGAVFILPSTYEVAFAGTDFNEDEGLIFSILDKQGNELYSESKCMLFTDGDIDSQDRLDLEGAVAGVLVIDGVTATDEDAKRLEQLEKELHQN